MNTPVLLLAKKDRWSEQAAALAKTAFGDALIIAQGKVGDAPPVEFSLPGYRMIISFLSPWIVPAKALSQSALSINFHPGSVDYPGIGCYNFALYENAHEFGAVAHHMLPKVDSGTVIKETLFSVQPDDRVETLKLRTMEAMLTLFSDLLPLLSKNAPLPTHSRQWSRRAFTRRELNALCELTPDMSEREKQRRIRATTYPGYPGPYLLLANGEKHYCPVPPGPALA